MSSVVISATSTHWSSGKISSKECIQHISEPKLREKKEFSTWESSLERIRMSQTISQLEMRLEEFSREKFKNRSNEEYVRNLQKEIEPILVKLNYLKTLFLYKEVGPAEFKKREDANGLERVMNRLSAYVEKRKSALQQQMRQNREDLDQIQQIYKRQMLQAEARPRWK